LRQAKQLENPHLEWAALLLRLAQKNLVLLSISKTTQLLVAVRPLNNTMASQLLPLGPFGLCDVLIILLIYSIELIDKCVGSKIWVVMKGDKGEAGHSAIDFLSSNVL
jgi:hypothetical protein